MVKQLALGLTLVASLSGPFNSGVMQYRDTYPREIFEGNMDIVRPNYDYPKSTDSVDSAKISAVVFKSTNDEVDSYFKFNSTEAQESYWGQLALQSYTILDWRQYRSPNDNDTGSKFRSGSSDEWTLQFKISNEARRAINVLGERAFIVEDVNPEQGTAWNQLNAILDRDGGNVKRSIGLMALYKAVGREHMMPPMVHMTNLDEMTASNSNDSVPILYTSLASLDSAQRFAFYDVIIQDAVHWVYQCPNMMEGYLWDAIQDGVISETELTSVAKNRILSYVFPNKAQNKLGIITKHNAGGNGPVGSDTQPMMLMHTDIRQGTNGNYPVLKLNPDVQAFKDETISLINYLKYVKQVMEVQGEPVLTLAESQTLTSAYGSKLAMTMSDDYYNTILYLVARGIIDDGYVDRLYAPLTYSDMYIICSRVADSASRLTFKYVSVPFNLKMANNGFIEVQTVVDNFSTTFKGITYSAENSYYDLLVEKNNVSTMRDSLNRPVRPYISRSDSSENLAYGTLIDENYVSPVNGKAYYHFRFYTKDPVPAFSRPGRISGELYAQYKMFGYGNSKGVLLLDALDTDHGPYGGVIALDAKGTMVEDKEATATLFGSDFNLLVKSLDFNTKNAYASGLRDYGQYKDVLMLAEAGNSTEKTTTTLSFSVYTENVEALKLFDQTYDMWFATPDGETGQKYQAGVTDMNAKISVAKDPLHEHHYDVVAVMSSIVMDDPTAIISQSVKMSDTAASSNIAFIRRGYEDDIYYSKFFVEQELKARITKVSDIFFEMALPDRTVKIQKTASGWVVFGNSSIMRFSTSIPAVEESDDNLFIHGLILEEYLRTNYSMGWSKFISTDGVIHISETKTEYTARPNIQMSPLLGAAGKPFSTDNVVFRDNDGKHYLDLSNVPSYLSNFIVYWDIVSVHEVGASLVSVYPSNIFKGTNNFNKLKSMIGIDINVSDRANESLVLKYEVPLNFKNSETEQTSIFSPNERLKIYPELFLALYELPSVDGGNLEALLKDESTGNWQLPYGYSPGKNKVYFLNLPFNRLEDTIEFTKLDVAESLLLDMPENLRDDILSKVNEENVSSKVKAYIPTNLISQINETLTPTIIRDIQYEAKMLVAGPYYTWLLVDSPNNDVLAKKTLPSWAYNLYGSEDKISYNTKVLTYRHNNAFGIILPPGEGILSLNANAPSLVQSLKRLEKAELSVRGDTLFDKANKVFDARKRLEDKLTEANALMGYIYLICLLIVPRVLIGCLFVLESLCLVLDWQIFLKFCARWFDPVYALSLFTKRAHEANKLEVFLYCSLAIIFLLILSEGLFTALLFKMFEAFV